MTWFGPSWMTAKWCEQHYATAKWQVITLRYDCSAIVIPTSKDGQLLYDAIPTSSRVDDCSVMPFPSWAGWMTALRCHFPSRAGWMTALRCHFPSWAGWMTALQCHFPSWAGWMTALWCHFLSWAGWMTALRCHSNLKRGLFNRVTLWRCYSILQVQLRWMTAWPSRLSPCQAGWWLFCHMFLLLERLWKMFHVTQKTNMLSLIFLLSFPFLFFSPSS